jgi:hypothetical protein
MSILLVRFFLKNIFLILLSLGFSINTFTERLHAVQSLKGYINVYTKEIGRH